MAFFSLDAPGLTIFPNHRLVHRVDGFSLARLSESARRWFEVAPLADPLAFRPTNRALGVVTADSAVTLTLRPDAFDALPWPAGTSRAWRELAVSILHQGGPKPAGDVSPGRFDVRTPLE